MKTTQIHTFIKNDNILPSCWPNIETCYFFLHFENIRRQFISCVYLKTSTILVCGQTTTPHCDRMTVYKWRSQHKTTSMIISISDSIIFPHATRLREYTFGFENIHNYTLGGGVFFVVGSPLTVLIVTMPRVCEIVCVCLFVSVTVIMMGFKYPSHGVNLHQLTAPIEHVCSRCSDWWLTATTKQKKSQMQWNELSRSVQRTIRMGGIGRQCIRDSETWLKKKIERQTRGSFSCVFVANNDHWSLALTLYILSVCLARLCCRRCSSPSYIVND